MTYNFQAMVERNLTIQQHNARAALQNSKPDYTAQVSVQLNEARAALNMLNAGLFSENIGVA